MKGKILYILIVILFFSEVSCKKSEVVKIEYPVMGYFYSVNMLAIEKLRLFSDNEYSFSAFVPSGGDLKIIIKSDVNGGWCYKIPPVNWMVSSYLNGMQTFTITQSGEKADLMIQFNKGIYTIEYYENTAIYPTYRKIVTVY